MSASETGKGPTIEERRKEEAKAREAKAKAREDEARAEEKRVFSRTSEAKFLRNSGKLGVGVLATSLVVGAAGGYIFGEGSGKDAGIKQEAARLVPRGELHPDVELLLIEGDNTVAKIQGWTAENIRENSNMIIPEFPFPILEGELDPESTTSNHSWIAVSKDGIYLETEDEDTVGDLTRDLSSAKTAAGSIDKSLGYEPGDLSDFLEAEIASLRDTGLSIFNAGHVVTSHEVEVNGVTMGIAIGRDKDTPNAPLSYKTFDSANDAPLPEGVSAGGFIVSK